MDNSPPRRRNIDSDFRVPGLSHAVVKEAENFRVQELVKKIESHPHREALQADLQQNNVYNPFSNNSKEMIRELGNVELFELCETVPKVQCSHCLLYWNQGIVHCNCGQFLVERESRRKFHKLRLDALSIPHYVIKKGRCHGARHGKTEEQKEYHVAWNAKRCLQKSWLSRWIFYRYSRLLSQRPSLSRITTRNRMDRTKVQRDGRTCKTTSHIQSLHRGIQKIPRTMVSHLEKVRQKCAYATLTRFSSCSLSQKPSSSWVRWSRLQNLFLLNSIGDDTLPQAIHGGTRLTGVGGAHDNFFKWPLFVTVEFVYSRWRSTVTDGRCRQLHVPRHVSPALCACFLLWITHNGSRRAKAQVSACTRHLSLYSDLNSFHVENAKANIPCVSANEESCPLAGHTPPTLVAPGQT